MRISWEKACHLGVVIVCSLPFPTFWGDSVLADSSPSWPSSMAVGDVQTQRVELQTWASGLLQGGHCGREGRIWFCFVCLFTSVFGETSSPSGFMLTTSLPQPLECWDFRRLHATTTHQSILKKPHLGTQLRSACLAYTKPWLPSSAPHRTGYGDADLRP